VFVPAKRYCVERADQALEIEGRLRSDDLAAPRPVTHGDQRAEHLLGGAEQPVERGLRGVEARAHEAVRVDDRVDPRQLLAQLHGLPGPRSEPHADIGEAAGGHLL
jgi:hypothetical protein